MSKTRLMIPALRPLYERLAPFTELAIRLVAGLSLVAHSYPILFGNTQAAVNFFAQAGFSPAEFWAMTVGLTELIGGLCLAAGFVTRVAAVAILIFLVNAILYHRHFGFYWEIRGFEYPLFWAIVVVHFLLRGAGPWSIDALIGREI